MLIFRLAYLERAALGELLQDDAYYGSWSHGDGAITCVCSTGDMTPAGSPKNGSVIGPRDISSLQSTMYTAWRVQEALQGSITYECCESRCSGAVYFVRESKIAAVKPGAVVRKLLTQACQPITRRPSRGLKAARTGANAFRVSSDRYHTAVALLSLVDTRLKPSPP
ncbi:hypothetical protein OIDMADRAFT_60218 [Oidiodendron maius Zn]|uniref:Uncharacterized protein n=1 Tax=Oidiodendron maius (strain Zn) TaxID=913774 RepID=A0A0C3GXS5_OIDMZ|nr:hypothetical protein OIDMADRAFT_60218 [Oidiodendron maius Zn]